MSRAASALLRAMLKRAGGKFDRILLSDIRSTDWQSLTFTGERHTITLRANGEEAGSVAHAIACGIGDAEFTIPGQIVADITAECHAPEADGSVNVTIEALTIAE